MKKFLLLLVPLFVAVVACQGKPENSPKLPPTLLVKPQQRDFYNWKERHQAVKEANARIHPEYVIIGDSITHFWGGIPTTPPAKGEQLNRAPEAWKALFGNHSVVNMGFGFDYVDNAYYRIQDGELADAQPRVIIVMLGTNNIGYRKDKPEACAANMGAFLELLKQKAPQSKILLVSIPPRTDAKLKDTIPATNALYRKLVDMERVFYVDLCHAMAADPKVPGVANRKLFADNVHPNKAGYEVMGPVLQQALRKIDPQY